MNAWLDSVRFSQPGEGAFDDPALGQEREAARGATKTPGVLVRHVLCVLLRRLAEPRIGILYSRGTKTSDRGNERGFRRGKGQQSAGNIQDRLRAAADHTRGRTVRRPTRGMGSHELRLDAAGSRLVDSERLKRMVHDEKAQSGDGGINRSIVSLIVKFASSRIVVALTCAVVISLIAFELLHRTVIAIDIQSGKLRYQTVMLGMVCNEDVVDTEFSIFVRDTCGRHTPGTPEWHPVSETGWTQPRSPHFRHHGSADDLEHFMKFRKYSKEAMSRECEMAATLLDALNADDPFRLDELAEAFMWEMLDSEGATSERLNP